MQLLQSLFIHGAPIGIAITCSFELAWTFCARSRGNGDSLDYLSQCIARF